MTKEPTHPVEQSMDVDFKKYYIAADLTQLLCIDERPKTEQIQKAVRIPGGVYSLIDAIKSVGHMSEEQAWQLAHDRNIPMDAHTDDHHHEGNEGEGCGYAATVQKSPETVGAVEAISANERLERAKTNGGQIYHYTGGHRPTHAVINYTEGKTIDQQAAWNDGYGPFTCDVWAISHYAKQVGLDEHKMTDFILSSFRKTVTHLAPGTPFVELRT